MRIPAMIPAYDTRGLLSASFLLGCAFGALSALLPASTWNWLPVSRGPPGSARFWAYVAASFLAALAITLFPPGLFGAALTLLTNRRGVVFLAGAIVCVGYQMTVTTVMSMFQHEEILGTAQMLALFAQSLAIGSIVCGVIVLIAHQLARVLVFRVFVGTPSTCRKCSYDAATDLAKVCPECGAPIEPDRYRFRALHTLMARVHAGSRGLRFAALSLLAVLVVYIVIDAAFSPVNTFARQFRDKGELSTAMIYARGTWPNNPTGAAGVVIRTAPDSTTVVWIGYFPHDRVGLPAMQLQLHTETSASGFGLGRSYASSAVLCDLDRAQAEWVVKNGLPQGLADAMVRSAPAAPWGGPTPVYVDPTPYVPGK